MVKKWISAGIVSAMLLTAAPVFAETQTVPAVGKNVVKAPKLIELAQKRGIDTTDKTPKQLKKELMAKQKEAKQQRKQKELAKLTDMAKRLGVETAGLTKQQLKEAVKAKEKAKREQQTMNRLTKAAKKFGLDATGKSKEQLKAEVLAKVQEKKQQKQAKAE
ncbi:hypothetical protein [Paenibacillus silviterrae]|uniref:hypothetical protein n=1 Tax=Paenibacillus silviterrae TaxID=3242194 RepID=UPI002542C1C7|nr:hypothetical protein [Paenibacillus chinjuensis]